MTMTDQQALDEYAKLADVVGCPEWGGPGTARQRIRLYDDVIGIWGLEALTVTDDWVLQYLLQTDGHMALCVCQNHVRQWLANTPGIDMHTAEGPVPDIILVFTGDPGKTRDAYFGNESQDANLIAAAKWVAEQKGTTDG